MQGTYDVPKVKKVKACKSRYIRRPCPLKRRMKGRLWAMKERLGVPIDERVGECEAVKVRSELVPTRRR
jgi:hypothetical protein